MLRISSRLACLSTTKQDIWTSRSVNRIGTSVASSLSSKCSDGTPGWASRAGPDLELDYNTYCPWTGHVEKAEFPHVHPEEKKQKLWLAACQCLAPVFLTMHVKVLHVAQPSALLIGSLPSSPTAGGHAAQHELVKTEQNCTNASPPHEGPPVIYEPRMKVKVFHIWILQIGNTGCRHGLQWACQTHRGQREKKREARPANRELCWCGLTWKWSYF